MMKKLTLVCLSLAIPCFMWGQKLDAAPKADKNLDVVLDNGMNVDKAAIERGTVVLNDDFEVGSGWTMGTLWTRGTAVAEPATAHSGTKILAYAIGADYANSIASASYATSPVFNCSGLTTIFMDFWSFSGCQSSSYDHIGIEVFDGTNWVSVWANGSTSFQETQWTFHRVDISAEAAGVSNARVRFYQGLTNGTVRYSGWAIDDLLVYEPLDNNLTVSSVEIPSLIYTGDTLRPVVTILNSGINQLGSFTVNLYSEPAGYDETLTNSTSLAANTPREFEFPAWVPVSDTFRLFARASLSGDQAPEDDLDSAEVVVRLPMLGDTISIMHASTDNQFAVETDGTHIYTCNNSNTFYRYTMDGELTNTATIAGVGNIYDLAYNPTNGHFYGGSVTPTVYELDLASFSKIGELTAPVDVWALTYDESSSTFYGNYAANDIIQFDALGVPAGDTIGITSQGGLAYDKWSGAHPSLWSAQTIAGSPARQIIEISLDSLQPTGRVINPADFGFTDPLGGIAAYEDAGHAYLLATIQTAPTTIVRFYLAKVTYRVTFNISDGTNPITGAEVYINNHRYAANLSGRVAVGGLEYGSISYKVTAPRFDDVTGTVDVTANKTINVTMHAWPESLSQEGNQAVKVFPNPCQDQLTIAHVSGAEITVYSHLGQRVGQWQVTEENLSISTTSYAPGLYFIQIVKGTESLVKKVVIE